jgi:hypothetical protein
MIIDSPEVVTVIITPLKSPALIEGSNGKLKISLDEIMKSSDFSNPTLISIPSMQVGGNHKHSHRELFLSLDDFLELHWVDSVGCKHQRKMRDSSTVWLFEIPPGIPHAVVNTSENLNGTLVEFADAEPLSVEYYPVYI